MKKLTLLYKILFFSLIATQIAYAHAPSRPAQCKGIFGIREMQDFRNDGTEYINYTKTPLYSSQNDETFFQYFAMNKSVQRQLDPVVNISILNHKKGVIKTYSFNKWADHQNFKDMAYAKFNFQQFIRANLSGPFDVYINLNKEERAKISLDDLPYSADISITDEQGKVLCSYSYAYASNYHNH